MSSDLQSLIQKIDVEDLNIPLTEPFGISGGAQAVANNLLVRLTLSDGTVGIGEGAPLPPYNGETQQIAKDAINLATPFILNTNSNNWRSISELLEIKISHSGSARCAIETALLDALAKQKNTPLYSFFGNKKSVIETDMTITTQANHSKAESINHAINSTQAILDRGIRIIKTKIGSNSAVDIERIQAIHRLAPHAPLILDGNGGFTADEALRIIEKLRALNIIPALFEQPVPGEDIEGLKKVTQLGGVLVAADESVKDKKTAKIVIDEKASHVVNIKIMKCGLIEAFDIATMCHQSGMGLMVGGNVESILAMTTSAHLSYGTGYFQYHDLDTPAWMLKNPFQGGFIQEGGFLSINHVTCGHGVTAAGYV